MKKTKLISLFILFSISLFSKNVVSLKLQNEKLSVAMNLITQQTGVEFSYNPRIVDANRVVSIAIINKDVKEAIDLLLGDIYLYTIKGRYVIITSAKKIPEIPIDNKPVIEESKKNNDKSSGKVVHSGLSSIGDRKIASERIEPGSPLLINNQVNETTMLKKIAGIITLSALTWGGAEAQLKQPDIKQAPAPKIEYNIGLQKSLAQLTFITPMSTDGSSTKEKEYKISLNILGGITGGVNGFEFGGLFNINKHDMRGVQLAGLFNATQGNASGIQLGELANYVEGDMKGLQMGGLVNIVRKSGDFQLAGIANYTGEINKVQIAGVANIATGSRFQMAAVANYAQGADVQIGTVNIAQHAGFQMGIINISETDEAAMLGLFNYVKKGGLFEVGISANDYIYGAVNLVTGTDKLYSILSFGVSSSNVTTGFGLGTRLQLGDSPRGIHFELMHNQIYRNDFKNKGRGAELDQVRVFYSVRKNKFTFYGGPTINVLLRDTDFTEVKDPVYSIFENRGNKHNFDLWVGAEIGVRFNLK
jgi:hypothetical protein